MAEVAQGTPILFSVLAFIGVLALFVVISFFSNKRKKGLESAIAERAKLEGKTIISSEEAKKDIVSIANSLAATVDALAEEREKISHGLPQQEERSIKDNITHLEDSLHRGATLLNDTIRDSKEVSPAQLAQVRSIIASIAPDIKAERYSELRRLVNPTM